MPLSETRKGEMLILANALLWSLFPVTTKLTFNQLSVLWTAGISTLASVLFFAAVLTIRRRWREVLQRRAWKDILLATLFIGILFYALLFLGLKYTTAGNASIDGLMEVFFAFLFLSVLTRHEPLMKSHVWGALCMVAGAVIILSPKQGSWYGGDALVILATAFAPIGNLYATRARKLVSSECIMFLRSILGGVFLLGIAAVFEPVPSMSSLRSSIYILLFNSIVLLGFSKLLWIEALHRIPITKGISISSIAPLFTILAARILLGETITFWQISALLPILLGVHLLTKQTKYHA